MADPVIIDIPTSVPADQIPFFQSVKTSIDYIFGHGRNLDEDRALRVGELENLGINIPAFLNSSLANPYPLGTSEDSGGDGGGTTPSQETPDPPTGLTVSIGIWTHTLTWTNPTDENVWYIEIWMAVNSQDRSSATLRGIWTITDDERGETVSYVNPGVSTDDDYTYWIRSVSYAYNASTWEPPDAQGGTVVQGIESLNEAIERVMDVLKGSTPALYDPEALYSQNDRCRTSDGRSWKSIYIGTHSGNEPPNATYWERSGILLQGDVDGVSTLGVDGNQVIDGSLKVRSIETGALTSEHLAANQVLIGHTIQSENYSYGTSGFKLNAVSGNANFHNFTMSFSGSGRSDAQTALNVEDGANNVTDTDQLADGASLGLTALWSGVSGTGKPANYADNTQTALDLGADIEHALIDGTTLIQNGYIRTNFLDVNNILISDDITGTVHFTSAGKITFGSANNYIYGDTNNIKLNGRGSTLYIGQTAITMNANSGYGISITGSSSLDLRTANGEAALTSTTGDVALEPSTSGKTYYRFGATTKAQINQYGFRSTLNNNLLNGDAGYYWYANYATTYYDNGGGYNDTLDDLLILSQYEPRKQKVVDPDTKEEAEVPVVDPKNNSEFLCMNSVPEWMTNKNQIRAKLRADNGEMLSDEDIEAMILDYDEAGWMIGRDIGAFNDLTNGAVRQLDLEIKEMYELIFSRLTALETKDKGK